ncbi:hypothetical protein [Haloferula rosea]|uniref:Uncharacterized protein n=1 Tax=Haloferula rosea TaxID=490093 RepID=A0A934RAK9_9BACT|nr:hypothetical protein [Haloferula rosea]MBK1827482.1 hypothetical protein [Haloferula rosea]
MTWRRSDLFALAFFTGAAVLLILLQVVPFSYGRDYSSGASVAEMKAFMGYRIWPELLSEVIDPGSFDLLGAAISGGLLLGTLVVLVSPFVIGIVAANRVLWWFIAVSSSLVVVGLTVMFCWLLVVETPNPDYWQMGPGLVCIMVFPMCHLAGVLCIRRREADTSLASGVETR